MFNRTATVLCKNKLNALFKLADGDVSLFAIFRCLMEMKTAILLYSIN